MRLKEMPEDDRPRERLLREGSATLSDVELLAVLLRTGRRGQSVMELAIEILSDSGGVAGLLETGAQSFVRPGLGAAKMATLLAAIELGRRLARGEVPDRRPLDKPELVARYLSLRYSLCDQEVMGALYLDVRHRLLAEAELYRGTLSRATVEPRAILKEALLRGASSFVLFHTHPSGDPSPSEEDYLFTRRMVQAGELVGVALTDHMILGTAGRWTSMKRLGVIRR